MKKIISVFLSITMLLTITAGLNLTAFADTPTSGQCGENAYYSYDSTTKTLTITGSGSVDYIVDEPYTTWVDDESGYSYEDTRHRYYSLFKDYNVETIVLNGGFSAIGGYMFCECKALKAISIPNTVKTIDKFAFKDCENLENVTIGSGITDVLDGAFENCTKINNLYFNGSLKQWCSISFNCYYSYPYRYWHHDLVASTNPIYNADSFYINNKLVTSLDFSGVNIINSYSFIGYEKLSEIVFDNSLTEIGRLAFAYCSGIKSVSIPDSVTNLGGGAFYQCDSLERVSLGKGITGLESAALSDDLWSDGEDAGTFGGNNRLTSIVIPDNIETIGIDSFSTSLKSVKINGKTIVGYKGGYWNEYEYGIPVTITNLEFSSTTTTISDSILSLIRTSNVTDLVIPNKMTYITDAAFKDATKIRTITIPKTVTRIEYNAFSGCTNLTIKGYKNSYAENYATMLGIPFEALDSSSEEHNHNHNHNYTTKTTVATTRNNGSVVVSCDICGHELYKQTIYRPSEITLSNTTYTYDGKEKKPTVTVTNINRDIVSANNYTVNYSDNKNVGKATVTIIFNGNYDATVSKIFTINPKPTKITSFKAKSKGFTIKWKKIAAQVDGYQIQYSNNRKFKAAKTVTVKGKKKNTISISKLKSKKKYYVRIRSCKKVGKTKYYSAWSKTKSLKTSK